MKILVIGPRFNRNRPSIIGGAIALFEDLISQFDKNKINYICVDTNKSKYKNFIFAYILIVYQILFKHKTCSHISLHSSRDYIIFGPIVILVGKLFNKKTSLRKFGGEAENNYKKSKSIKKGILKFIFTNMNTLFFETKYLVEFFSAINKKTFWFPNVRERLLEPTLPRSFRRRFVFISHVKQEKGIDEILEVSKSFDDGYTIDIYGPITDTKYTQDYFKDYQVNYLGSLNSMDVLKVLDQYDVLLLPSYQEGYPGIVIEAYSLGIPVISTSLRGLKEIVELEKTGILIEPKNVAQFVSAIEFFNDDNYAKMSKNAYRKFNTFNSDVQTKLFLKRLTDA